MLECPMSGWDSPSSAIFLEAEIDTLVFVLDPTLRTIPMSPVYDRKEFLVEKYAVATTLGLEPTDPGPPDRAMLSPPFDGLSESVEDFPALGHVGEELQNAQHLYGGQRLLDTQFVDKGSREELSMHSFNVRHLASHGAFGKDANDSFLLTYDGRLTIEQLAEYLVLRKFRERPVELFVPSACVLVA